MGRVITPGHTCAECGRTIWPGALRWDGRKPLHRSCYIGREMRRIVKIPVWYEQKLKAGE